MRWGLVVWCVVAVACSGGKSSTGDDDDDDDDDDVVAIDCTELPSYNLDTMTCEQLGTAFSNTAAASVDCNVDEDCAVVHPACEHWNAVICYYPANYCLEAALVSEYNSRSAGCTDGSDVCDCGAPPGVACVQNRCRLVDTSTAR